MARVVICGAGIAGVSTAFHLTRAGCTDVVVVDPRPPLTLTSDKSTECYRNWWPSRPMVHLMNRSIKLLDDYTLESNNVFGMSRRGYLYLTAETATLDDIGVGGAAASAAGAGDMRVHDTKRSSYDPDVWDPGADLFLSGSELRSHFSWITDKAVGGLHARTAGWLSAQQLGMWMLEQAKQAGVTVVRSAVTSVTVERNEVRSVRLGDGTSIATPTFINAAGPMLETVGQMVGLDLPVFSEVHAKTAFRDHLGAIPRSAPMIIWSDPQRIEWSTEEAAMLADEGRHDLLGALPAGCHARPEGGIDSSWALGLWEYGATQIEPMWPIPMDPIYTEAVLRGLSTMTPGLKVYDDQLPEAVVDGGYYTKTLENRPLAGPAGPQGSYICGALSGFGIMAACAVGELVAHDVVGLDNPAWARWFDLRRYDDKTYVASIDTMGSSGQL